MICVFYHTKRKLLKGGKKQWERNGEFLSKEWDFILYFREIILSEVWRTDWKEVGQKRLREGINKILKLGPYFLWERGEGTLRRLVWYNWQELVSSIRDERVEEVDEKLSGSGLVNFQRWSQERSWRRCGVGGFTWAWRDVTQRKLASRILGIHFLLSCSKTSWLKIQIWDSWAYWP